MTFTDHAWEATTGIRAAIDAHPFLTGLGDGTLEPQRFTEYLAQDALYLAAYARVLAACATQADNVEQVALWGQAAANAITVEQVLHESHLAGHRPDRPSPTCLAYTSYLAALSTQGAYPVLVAGLLPCFWIYDDVGCRLRHRVPDLASHPYRDWIATYGDPAFTAATDHVKHLTDQLAERSTLHVRQQMLTAFTTASRYEWMFWDAAWRHEQWPV